MPTHTVASDTNTGGIQLRESGEHRLREFLCDVGVHVIAVVVGWVRGVDVEACSRAEVPGVGFTGNVETAWISLGR